MTNNEGIPKSRDDSANLLHDFFLEDDYNSVSDIAAERSLTPSSSHLNCGAVAPAIKAYKLQIKDRWDSLELIIIHPNDQKKKKKKKKNKKKPWSSSGKIGILNLELAGSTKAIQ